VKRQPPPSVVDLSPGLRDAERGPALPEPPGLSTVSSVRVGLEMGEGPHYSSLLCLRTSFLAER
jgi:hypothetical protein